MHKKYILSLLGLLGCLPIFAAQNNISMVSYFPVPYALYEDVYVTQRMDLGLNSKCLLSVGRGRNVPIQANKLYLNGDLALFNIATLTTSGTVTIGDKIDNVMLIFGNNLNIGSIGNGGTMESFNATNLYLTNGPGTFHLFNSDYVSNNTKWIEDCSSGAHWEKLKGADGNDYIYLVCNDTDDGKCSAKRVRKPAGSPVADIKSDTCNGDGGKRFNETVYAKKTCMDVYSVSPLSFGTVAQCTKSCKGSNPECDECSSASDCTGLDNSATWKCVCYGSRMTCMSNIDASSLGLLQAPNGNYYADPNSSAALVLTVLKDEITVCPGSSVTATQTKKKCLTNVDSCIHIIGDKDLSAGGANSESHKTACNTASNLELKKSLDPTSNAAIMNKLSDLKTIPATCQIGQECDCTTGSYYWPAVKTANYTKVKDRIVEEASGDFSIIEGGTCTAVPVARCIEVDVTESCNTVTTRCTNWSDGIEIEDKVL